MYSIDLCTECSENTEKEDVALNGSKIVLMTHFIRLISLFIH